MTQVSTLSNGHMTYFFEATVQAVEEAIINAMMAAETMSGINGNKVYALPHDLLLQILKKLQPVRKINTRFLIFYLKKFTYSNDLKLLSKIHFLRSIYIHRFLFE